MATHLPDDFKCPISLEIMSDPVILSSGHTFDRSSIQRWLDSGHRTCPITKLPLPEHPCLIPNHALRSLISSFTIPKSQPDPNPCRNLNPDQSKKYQTQLLIYTLVSPSSTLESKLHSLSQLTRLTKLDSGPRRQLTESGAVSAVLNCVNSTESEIQEKALALLLNLSLDDDNKVGLVAEGVISRVINVIRAGSASSRAIGCTILTSLAVVEVNKATIGAYPNAIKTLIWVLYSGKGREVREAATALYAICSFVDNRKRAVECGAVPILMKIGGMGLERAVEVLSLLVKCKEGREEMRKVNGCLEVLVKVIRNGSERGVQCALLTLSCLCCFAEEMRVEAEKEGVLEICVGFLDDENEKIRRHASTLVQTLSGRG
ncbi:U-box domain-containing protein 8 [Populus alba]|uniref:RING-type E3 ubiquitin transferase n=1 Tax=Populus alba TaxID=43335 RepID=A0A4U5PQ96_POPAL|nr:U-box domain-containing protein 8-like [Populus alba]TKR99043.1 U-box domain-containing family protein [Populus alba]